MITLVLHGELRRHSAGAAKTHTVDGARRSIREVLERAGLPKEAIDTSAFVVNGDQVEIDAPLEDGDSLDVIPAINGGCGGINGGCAS